MCLTPSFRSSVFWQERLSVWAPPRIFFLSNFSLSLVVLGFWTQDLTSCARQVLSSIELCPQPLVFLYIQLETPVWASEIGKRNWIRLGNTLFSWIVLSVPMSFTRSEFLTLDGRCSRFSMWGKELECIKVTKIFSWLLIQAADFALALPVTQQVFRSPSSWLVWFYTDGWLISLKL